MHRLIAGYVGLFEITGTAPDTHRSANANQHQSRHQKIIDAARESAIARSDKSLHRRFSMSCQMRTLPFDVEVG